MRSPTERIRAAVAGRAAAFAIAPVTVLLTLLLTLNLGRWARADFTALYVLAMLIASSVGGLGSGLFATALAATATAYTQVGWSRELDLGLDDIFRLMVFVLTAVVVSSLAARRRSAEARLRDAVYRLKQADRTKDEFLATLSHELKTPLTSILGWGTILAGGNVDEELVATAGDSIRESAKTQQYLIDELLDISRIVFGKFRMELHPVDLASVARAAAALIRPVVETKRLRLHVDLPLSTCVIHADEHRIKQVIWNFLANAVKFTPAGGRITLSVAASGKEAEITVTDSGDGIEAEALPYVFEQLHQTDAGASKGGLGLGLAISRHVIEAHGGSVAAFSEGRGKGARFVARLPMMAPQRALRSDENSERAREQTYSV